MAAGVLSLSFYIKEKLAALQIKDTEFPLHCLISFLTYLEKQDSVNNQLCGFLMPLSMSTQPGKEESESHFQSELTLSVQFSYLLMSPGAQSNQ